MSDPHPAKAAPSPAGPGEDSGPATTWKDSTGVSVEDEVETSKFDSLNTYLDFMGSSRDNMMLVAGVEMCETFLQRGFVSTVMRLCDEDWAGMRVLINCLVQNQDNASLSRRLLEVRDNCVTAPPSVDSHLRLLAPHPSLDATASLAPLKHTFAGMVSSAN